MSRIRQLMDRVTPKMNPIIAEGVAYHQTKHSVDYLKAAMRSAAKSFPPGLLFEDCVRCTPYEEYDRLNARATTRRFYDVAISHLSMIKFMFNFEGEKFSVFVNIPFVGPGGLFKMNNSEYMISPTLNDIVFSVTADSIFVRLLRDRMRFQRFSWRFETLQGRAELASVVWCPIHKGRSKTPYIVGNTTNVHYLFAKYGFSGAFERYLGFKPIVGESEINHENYPADKWVICRTGTSLKPKAVKSSNWAPSNIRVAIPIEHYTQQTVSYLGALFYVLDLFPTYMKPEWMDVTRQWRILLGLLIFSGDKHGGELHEDVLGHLRSLDQYLDMFVEKQLRTINVKAENVYDLLNILVEKFTEWSSASSDRISTLYDKELNVNYFLLFRITKHIFESVFEMTKKTNSGKSIDKNDIKKIFDRELTVNSIFKIITDNKEVSIPQSPNDSMVFRITSIMIPQSANEANANSSHGISLDDPAHFLHASLMEVAGYNSMSKSHPDSRHRINPYVLTDEDYRVVRREKFRPLLDEVQSMIRLR